MNQLDNIFDAMDVEEAEELLKNLSKEQVTADQIEVMRGEKENGKRHFSGRGYLAAAAVFIVFLTSGLGVTAAMKGVSVKKAIEILFHGQIEEQMEEEMTGEVEVLQSETTLKGITITPKQLFADEYNIYMAFEVTSDSSVTFPEEVYNMPFFENVRVNNDTVRKEGGHISCRAYIMNYERNRFDYILVLSSNQAIGGDGRISVSFENLIEDGYISEENGLYHICIGGEGDAIVKGNYTAELSWKMQMQTKSNEEVKGQKVTLSPLSIRYEAENGYGDSSVFKQDATVMMKDGTTVTGSISYSHVYNLEDGTEDGMNGGWIFDRPIRLEDVICVTIGSHSYDLG